MELDLIKNGNLNQAESGFLFANKFKSFPVVNSTCYWLTENYNKLKETNLLTKCTCTLAESTLKSSIYLASPIVNKFKDQVNVLDSLACNQLNKLEQAFPIIKSDTNTIVNQSKELINQTVQPAVNRYVYFRTNTENKCKAVKSYYGKHLDYCNQISLSTNTKNFAYKLVDLCQNLIENYLNYTKLMPGQNQQVIDEYLKTYLSHKYELMYSHQTYQNLIKRIRILTYVLICSIEANLMRQAKSSLKVLRSQFRSILKTIESYDSLKKRVVFRLQDKFHVTKDKIDLYKEYLDVLSKQFTVQDGRSLQHVHSLEERTKIVIRRSLGNLLTAFHLIYSRLHNVLPLIQCNFNRLRHHAVDLYQIYNKHDGSFNEMIAETFLREFNELLVKAECSMNVFLKNFNNSAIISWFVPNFDTFGILDDDFDEFEINRQPSDHLLNNHNNGAVESEGELNTNCASLATLDLNRSQSLASDNRTDSNNSSTCSTSNSDNLLNKTSTLENSNNVTINSNTSLDELYLYKSNCSSDEKFIQNYII